MSMIYQTRLNGLKVQIQRSQMLGEKDKVVFIWSSETGFPLTLKQKEKIESNCIWYISGDGVKNKLYPITDEDKRAIPTGSATSGKYVSVSQALKEKF